jgi:hypothetical protein
MKMNVSQIRVHIPNIVIVTTVPGGPRTVAQTESRLGTGSSVAGAGLLCTVVPGIRCAFTTDATLIAANVPHTHPLASVTVAIVWSWLASAPPLQSLGSMI